MEKKIKKEYIGIDEYVNRLEKKLIDVNKLEEVRAIKNTVIPKYIEAYNNKKLKESDLIKLSDLISKIETKEKEIYEENTLNYVEDKELELMKEYIELLKDVNKIIDVLEEE